MYKWFGKTRVPIRRGCYPIDAASPSEPMYKLSNRRMCHESEIDNSKYVYIGR